MPVDSGQGVPALFLVRAVVRDDLREDFDRWYEAEHLPQAREVLGARPACRSWSATDAGVHVALYEFNTLDELLAKVRRRACRSCSTCSTGLGRRG